MCTGSHTNTHTHHSSDNNRGGRRVPAVSRAHRVGSRRRPMIRDHAPRVPGQRERTCGPAPTADRCRSTSGGRCGAVRGGTRERSGGCGSVPAQCESSPASGPRDGAAAAAACGSPATPALAGARARHAASARPAAGEAAAAAAAAAVETARGRAAVGARLTRSSARTHRPAARACAAPPAPRYAPARPARQLAPPARPHE